MFGLEASLIWLAFAGILIAMGLADLATFKIPNELVIALLVLFFIAAAIGWPGIAPVALHLLLAGITLTLSVGLFTLNLFGAGDAKMLTATMLWAGFGALVPLLLYTALAGVLLLVVMLPIRGILVSRMRAGKMKEESLPLVFRPRSGVPYGVAMALGAILASSRFDPWLWQI